MGERSSYAKEHSHSKKSWIQKYIRFAWDPEESWRDSIRIDTIGDERERLLLLHNRTDL